MKIWESVEDVAYDPLMFALVKGQLLAGVGVEAIESTVGSAIMMCEEEAPIGLVAVD